MFSSQLKRLLHCHRWRLTPRVSACQSVRQSVSQRVGVAYLARAIAHNALKPPIKSFAMIEMMPASLMRLDESLISTQLQQGDKEIRQRRREGKRERGAQLKYKIQVQQQSRSNPICHWPSPLILKYAWKAVEKWVEERCRGRCLVVVPPQAEGSYCCYCLRFACGDGGCYWIFKIYRFYVELPLPLSLPLLLSLPLPLALLPVRTLNPAATSTAAAGVARNMRVLVV